MNISHTLQNQYYKLRPIESGDLDDALYFSGRQLLSDTPNQLERERKLHLDEYEAYLKSETMLCGAIADKSKHNSIIMLFRAEFEPKHPTEYHLYFDGLQSNFTWEQFDRHAVLLWIEYLQTYANAQALVYYNKQGDADVQSILNSVGFVETDSQRWEFEVKN